MTPPKMKNKVGHTSSTILNSRSFQRYRPLSPVKLTNFNDHPLDAILKNAKSVYFIESLSGYLFNLKKTYILYFIIDNFS